MSKVLETEDWLALPAPEVAEDHAMIPAPMQIAAAPLPDELGARNAVFKAHWETLTPRQQLFLQALNGSNFNVSRTLRKWRASGDNLHYKTVYNWQTEKPAFAFCRQVLMSIAREIVADPARMLLRLDEIAEGALVPKPILFKGLATGYKEQNFTAALKATELQMRHGRLLGDEKETGFGGRNINLSVQVVMPGGELKDVVAKGVTIDAPVIEIAGSES